MTGGGHWALYQHLAANRTNKDVWTTQAADLLRQGDVCRAKLVLETALQNFPNDASAQLLLVQACLAQQAEADGVMEALAIARRLHARCATHAAEVQSAALAVAGALGYRARLTGSSDQLKQKCRAEAVQVLTDAGATTAQAPLLRYNLALLLAESGELEAAIAHAKAALELASAQGLATYELTTMSLVLLALLLSARQQHRSAITVLAASESTAHAASTSAGVPVPLGNADVLLARVKSKLLQSQSDDVGALAVLAQCKAKLAAADAAGVHAHGVSNQDLEAEVWQDLAIALAAQREFEDALACAQQSQQVWPWHASTYYAFGRVRQAQGLLDKAMDAYNTALALDPHHCPTLFQLGTLYHQRAEPADLVTAHDLLAEALRHDRANTQGWHQLGLVAKALGRVQDAEQHLSTAVALGLTAPVVSYSTLPLLLK